MRGKSGDIPSVMVPLTSAMTETLDYYEIWTPERRGSVQMLMSGLCHPQLEGLWGTWPLRCSCLRLHVYTG